MACNGDLKIIFFIFNSLTWFIPGIMSFSLGVGNEVLTQTARGANIFSICFGLVMMLVATQGYAGAITGNKKTINSYGGMCLLLSIGAIVLPSVVCEAKSGISNTELDRFSVGYMVLISYAVINLINLLLGVAVAVQAKREEVGARNIPK